MGYLSSLPLSGNRGHCSELPAAQYLKAVILYILCCFSPFKCEISPFLSLHLASSGSVLDSLHHEARET